MTIEGYLTLGDLLMRKGRYDDKNLAIAFLKTRRVEFTKETFFRIGNWFDYGINNWATTDVLCMLILSALLVDKVIDFENLKTWNNAESEWKRRAMPVSLVELYKLTKNLKLADTFLLIEPLMLDVSEYVQKGIGTLFRGL